MVILHDCPQIGYGSWISVRIMILMTFYIRVLLIIGVLDDYICCYWGWLFLIDAGGSGVDVWSFLVGLSIFEY